MPELRGLVAKTYEVGKLAEGMMNIQRLDVLIKQVQVVSDAIPIEQLKGDIARAGHPVKQALALDAEGRRLFFTDMEGEHLYAEFESADQGHRITHIGHQASIIKEYDVLDPEPEPFGKVEMDYEVEEVADEPEPGVIPGPTPGDKPEEDDRGFSVSKAELQQEAFRKALLIEMAD